MTTDSDGNVVFRDAGDDDDADFRAVDAYISSVNGVARTDNATRINDANSADGDVEVTVQSTGEDCVVVVAFDDADDDNLLDLDANDMPTEAFGISGDSTFATAVAVDATPEESLNPYATEHTVTAQLRTANDSDSDGVNNAAPVAGETIRFQVIRDATVTTGTAPDETVSCTGGTVIASGAGETDATGAAEFTYTGPNDPSTAANDTTDDCILVFWDEDNDGVLDTTEDEDYVAKTWTDTEGQASSFDAEPEQATNLVETNHTVTATVEDQFGNAIDGETVRFEVYREQAAAAGQYDRVTVATRTTGADGVATFIYTGPDAQADDVIVACADDPATDPADESTDCTIATLDPGADFYTLAADPDGTGMADSVEKFWVEAATDATGDVTGATVIGFDTDGNTVDVETTGGDNVRIPYDSDDQFSVDGDPATMTAFEEALSNGDTVDVTYNPDGVSTFALTNVTV